MVNAVTNDQRENLPAGRFDLFSRDVNGCRWQGLGLPTSRANAVKRVEFRATTPGVKRSDCLESFPGIRLCDFGGADSVTSHHLNGRDRGEVCARL
jgi:hypothetical protein